MPGNRSDDLHTTPAVRSRSSDRGGQLGSIGHHASRPTNPEGEKKPSVQKVSLGDPSVPITSAHFGIMKKKEMRDFAKEQSDDATIRISNHATWSPSKRHGLYRGGGRLAPGRPDLKEACAWLWHSQIPLSYFPKVRE